jgi:hypothetical protein
VQSEEGLALAEDHLSEFLAISDLTSVLTLQFTQSRSDRDSGTVSFDVTVTNTGEHRLLLPLVLQLSPVSHFDGEPLGEAGRAADGSWLIDLSENFPASGILDPGQSTTGRTITVHVPTRRPVAFDPSVSALRANVLPAFLTIRDQRVGRPDLPVPGKRLHENGDALSYLLVRGRRNDHRARPGSSVDAIDHQSSGSVVTQVYDSASGHDTQAFILLVAACQGHCSPACRPRSGPGRTALEILIRPMTPKTIRSCTRIICRRAPCSRLGRSSAGPRRARTPAPTT